MKHLALRFPVARLRSALRAVGGLVLALLGAATAAAQQPNLLQDGGFELSVVLGPGQFQRASSFGAWTSTPGCSGQPGSALLGMPYAGLPPYEGTKAMHIGDCNGPGSVSQTFSTTVGARYRVALSVIGWQGGSGTVRATVIDPSGTQLVVGDFAAPGGNVWNSGSNHSFTATATATTLRVQNISGASTIDSVSVTLDQQIVTQPDATDDFSTGLTNWAVRSVQAGRTMANEVIANPNGHPVIEIAAVVTQGYNGVNMPWTVLTSNTVGAVSDFDIAVSFAGSLGMGGGTSYGLVFGFLDANNYYMAHVFPGFGGSALRVEKVVAGNPMEVWAGSSGNHGVGFTWITGNNNATTMPDALRIRRTGNLFQCFVADSSAGGWKSNFSLGPTGSNLWTDNAFPATAQVGFGERFNVFTSFTPGARFAVFGSGAAGVAAVLQSTGASLAQSTVCTAPSITASPASLEVCYGSSRTLNATAAGTAPLSYQWRFNGTNLAGATASSLALTNIDFSYAGSYSCTVTNACGTATTAAATITVHPAGPDITTSPLSQTLCLGATASFTVEAHAHMQGVLQYQWFKDGLPIAGAPATATLSFPVTGLDDGGNYVCRVTEPNCGHSDSDAAVLTVNQAPSIDAVGPENVNEGQTAVSLQGSASDPDGGTLTYAWTQLAGGTPVSLNGANTLSPTFDAPIVAVGGETLTFKLTVTDACQSSEDTVSVSVVNINHPPVAEAGVDQSVAEGAPVTLDGEASFDIDGDPFSRSWVQVSGPTVTLSDPTASQPTFTAPVLNGSGAPGVVATLVFRLTVDDTYTPDAPAPGYNLSDVEDLVTIEITNVNNLPIAAAGVDQTVDENTAVALTGAGSSDPDGDTLTHAWVQIGTPTVTLSDPNAAAPTFTAPFVSAGGVDLTFRLTVDDGYGGTATDTIVVHVQNANDPPLASAARPSQALLWPPNHGMVAISILGVTDPNNNATITITGVTQDEATNGLGDGDTPVDAIINPDGTVLIRAERAGNGNGRVYRIHFTAADLEGSSSGVVTVSVPRDKKSVAVDGGALHVSTN